MSVTASLPMSAGPFPVAQPEKSLTLTQTFGAPESLETPPSPVEVPLALDAAVTVPVEAAVPPLDDVPAPVIVPLPLTLLVSIEPLPVELAVLLPPGPP
jgi:hypothetical protein